MRKTKHWLITTTMLLFSLAMNAYEAGDFVYTKVAKYKITGENLVVNGQFNQGDTGTDGWAATDATLPLGTTFTMGTDGPNGSNTLQVLAGQTALTNGMYQQVAITQSGVYVVSFKVKGATAGFTDLDLTGGNTNYMNAYYNTDGALASLNTDVLVTMANYLAFGENGVNGGYQFDYNADGFTDVSFAVEAPAEGYIMIDFRGLAEGLEIADVTCHSAENVYDDRIAKNRIAYIKLFLAEDGTEEKEYYEELQACIKTIEDAVQENASLSAMEECMGTLENTWQMFIDENFQSIIDIVPTTDGSENTGNSSANWMNWIAKYIKLNSSYDGKAPWSWSSDRWGHLSAKSNSSMSIRWQRGAINQWDNVATLTVTLPAGVYYWGVTGQGGMMTLNKSRLIRSWANECAMTQLSADDEYSETFVLNAARNEDYVFRFELTEKKEVSLRISCNIEEGSRNGCFAEFYSPILYQVIESDQLTAEQMLFLDEVSNLLNELKGRLDVANDYLADTQVLMPWGKETLQKETDKVQLCYDAWVALTQEELLEIFDNGEDLCSAIYTEIGNVNTSVDSFTELNIPLTDIPTAIDEAQGILEMRRYASSSLMDDLETMIAETQTMYEEYLETMYSVEAAETLIAQKASLKAMVEEFMKAIDADVLVDIDFGTQNNPASFETVEYTDDAGTINYYYTIAGAKGVMTFTDITGSYPYALGWGSATDETTGAVIATDSLGMLRVGNSEAVVEFSGAPVKETDIVNIKFDFYAANLTKSKAGYKVLTAEGDIICGLFYSAYDGNDDMNTFGIDYTKLPKVGSGSASNAAIAAASNRIQFDIVLDYGAKTMYCTTSSSKGVATSQIIPLPDLIPAQFVLYSNYNNADRRCWFDNLIIQNVSTEPVSEESVLSGKCGENLTWTLDGSELTIAGSGDMYSYTTSPWVDYSIEKVTIENGVTSIGERAFYNCTSLTSIIIPESVTAIWDYAFHNCNSLISIMLPDDVTWIGDDAFSDCRSLTSINIPNGMTYIRYYAFANCSSLTSITIPESIEIIFPGAFNGCSNLASIVIPEGVTTIGASAFGGCNSLTSITIPSSAASIQSGAFSGCSSLTSLTIPNTVNNIEEKTFEGCSSLISFTIPSSVTNIGEYAFDGCSSLASITIPEGVASIENGAFQNCTAFSAITIPSSVTSIGDYAFYNCSNLISFTIPSSVTSIGESVFSDCSSLTSITIPMGVTSIGNCAFYCCSSLSSITIPENVTSIGLHTFDFCSNLASITSNAAVPPVIESSTFTNVDKSIPVYVPAASVADYQEADYWKEFSNIRAMEDDSEIVGDLSGLNKVGSSTFRIEQEVLLNYETSSIKLDIDNIAALLGCSVGDMVLQAIDSDGYLSDHSTANAGGYWLTENGIICGWGNDAFLFVEPIADGDYSQLNIGQMPGNTAIGEEVHSLLYLTAGNNYYELDITLAIVIISETTTITLNQYGSGTFCSNESLDFSEVEGLKAYAATGYDTKTGIVTLTRVMTAKAGMGLFLKGTPGEYEIPVLENTSYNTLNMLVGTLENTVVNSTSDDGIYANYKYTILESNAAPMFYQFADGSTLGAGKAYLQIPLAWLPAVAKSISLRFDDGETTDIEEMESLVQPSDVIYDLMGRRVTTPQRGSLYLINGKKIIY